MKRKPNQVITTIRTGTGDKGTTFLKHPDISKADSLVDFAGDLDEANASIGPLVAEYFWIDSNSSAGDFVAWLTRCQNVLFTIGAGIHTSDNTTFERIQVILARFVDDLEDYMELVKVEEEFCELSGFIYPGETNCNGMIARAVVRRAERSAVKSDQLWAVPALNVMSDFLFMIAWFHSEDSKQWTGIDDDEY